MSGAARPRLALGVLAVLVVSFAAFSASRMFPPQPYGLADDWRVFAGAAAVVAEGGSPYDTAAIHAGEQRVDPYPSVQPSLDDYANLPIVAWLLQPFAAMPFWAGYAIAALAGIIAAALAMVAWLRRLGWRRPARWTAFALLSWPALLGVYSGQYDLVLLALLVAAMVLSTRGHAGLAGAVAAAAVVVKPHVLWPVPLLLSAAELPDRRAALRCAGAAAATALAAVGAGEALMPGSTARFVAHLVAFGGRIAAVQPDLAGLPGMVSRLPGGAALGVAIAAAGAMLVLGVAGLAAVHPGARRLPHERRVALCVGVGLAAWLLTTPYAHPNDDVLLFPLLALVLGRDAASLQERDLAWALGLTLAVVAAFVVAAPLGVVAGVAVVSWVMRRAPGERAGALAALALVAVAILPMAWPFHVLDVSLTPLAVLVVTVAGARLASGALAVRGGCSRAFAPAA